MSAVLSACDPRRWSQHSAAPCSSSSVGFTTAAVRLLPASLRVTQKQERTKKTIGSFFFLFNNLFSCWGNEKELISLRISGKNEKSFIRYQWSLLGVDGIRRGSSSCKALGCRPLPLLALPLGSTYSYRDCSLSVSRCSKPIHLSPKSASFIEGLTGAARGVLLCSLFYITLAYALLKKIWGIDSLVVRFWREL